ncbi:MAG: efflux RND transporter periplasmic adaptor subunit [Anaerolineales bacterium]|nr:efflux RND transporter periplasmic adaptor subunit [Anaerolineales bacterium]MCZ2121927.1 efflux RND transporter periplasmic adaptor subunit [Anaerolineales bacterium]
MESSKPMKRIILIGIMLSALLVSACGASNATAAIPTVSLDSNSQTSETPGASSGNVSASAVVVPVKKVELAFPIFGAVKTVTAQVGASVTAHQPLVALDAAILEAQVKEAEANVVIAQTTVAYLKRTGTDQNRLDAANADVARAQAIVEIAKAQLAQATLFAPFDGTIAAVNVAPAEVVNPGEVVVVLGDLNHFQVETTDLSEKDIAAVQVGDLANIFIEALQQEFGGKVTEIARVAQAVGGDVVYKVTLEFDQPAEDLRWGMSAKVKIAVQE